MAPRPRGASDIKTLAAVRGSGAHSNERHVHQFQIACLELERTRRIKEQEAAQRRAEDLCARLREIDAQIRRHQQALGVMVGGCDELAPALSAAGPRRVLRYGGGAGHDGDRRPATTAQDRTRELDNG